MRFLYLSTKELLLVLIFTPQGGISRVEFLRVCLVLAMRIEHHFKYTSILVPSALFNMSSCLKYSTWLLGFTSWSALRLAPHGFVLLWNRVGIDPKCKGGAVRVVEASAAIDYGMPIDAVLNTSR